MYINASSSNSFLLSDYGKDEDIIDEYKFEIEPREHISHVPSFHEYLFGNEYQDDYYEADNESFVQNVTEVPLGYEFENDDAAWVMACTFMIFTMQTGMEGTYIQGCHTWLCFSSKSVYKLVV